MPTIGNLFVNIGADAKGLESGLDKSKKMVSDFSRSSEKTQGVSLGGTGLKFLDKGARQVEEMRSRWTAVKGIVDGFNQTTKDAARHQEAVTAATKDSAEAERMLQKAKGDRRNIGEARVMLAQKGIDPNKAATQLQVVSLEPQRKELERLQATAKDTASKIAESGEKLKSMELSGRRTGDFKGMDKELEKRIELNKKLAEQLAKVSEAQAGIGKTRSSNRDREAIRGDLQKRGIDISKGQGSLELKGLAPFQKNAALAKANLKEMGQAALDSAGQFSFLGMRGGFLVGALGSVVAASIGAVVALGELVAQQAKLALAMSNSAAGAGISVEALQRMKETFDDFGMSDPSFAMYRLEMAMDSASEGSKGTQSAFKKLGLDLSALGKMAPDEQFEATMAGLRGIQSQSEKMDVGREIFGRGFREMASAASATEESFKKSREEAERLVVSGENVAVLKETGLAINDAYSAVGKLKMELSAAFAPVVKLFADDVFESLTSDTESWASAFKIVATVCAVIYDLLALVGNIVRVVVNLVTMLAKVFLISVLATVVAILKVTQFLVWAWESLTGSTHEASDALGEYADIAMSTSEEMAKGIAEDAVDIGTAMKDAVVPDAIIATWSEVEKAAYRAEQAAKKASASSAGIPIVPVLNEKEMEKVASNLDDWMKKNSALQFEVQYGAGEQGEFLSKMAQEMSEMPKGSSVEDVNALKEAIVLNNKLTTEKKRQAKAFDMQADFAKELFEINQDILATTGDQYANDYRTAELKFNAGSREAEAFADAKERLRVAEAQKKMSEEVVDIMKELNSKVSEIGKSESEILITKLAQNNASKDTIAKAQELQATLAQAKVGEDLAKHFESMNEKLLEAQGNEEQVLRAMLERMGVAGDALEDAVQKSLAIQKATEVANKAKEDQEDAVRESQKRQEDIVDTFEELRDSLKKATQTTAEYEHDKFVKQGMSPEQVKMADSMTAELARLEGTKDKSVTDSIDSVFGSMKMSGEVAGGAERVQAGILDQTKTQTQLLTDIAASVAQKNGTYSQIAPMDLGGMKSAAVGGSVAVTAQVEGLSRSSGGSDSLIQKSNVLLEKIATNTSKSQLEGVMR